MTEIEALSAHELEIWRVVLRMRRRLDRQLDAHLTSQGELREADYEVLRALYEEPGQAQRVGTLAEQIEWEHSRLSHKLKQMERRGLISRRTSRRDARGTVAALTPDGVAAYEQVRSAHRAWVKQTFIDALSGAELDQLGALSAKILERLAQFGEASADLDPLDL